jgi:Short C-terminal domain
MQERFQATRRIPPAAPAATPHVTERDTVADLKGLSDLHASGVLTEEEFTAAKARILGNPAGPR